MCLHVHPDYPGLYRAGYDIIVWKRLCKLNRRVGWVSPYQYTPYEFGVMKQARILSRRQAQKDVYEGLHAYTSAGQARARYGLKHGDPTLFPAIIPKGTLFRVGRRGECISEQLIVYESLPAIKRRVTIKGDFSQHKRIGRYVLMDASSRVDP